MHVQAIAQRYVFPPDAEAITEARFDAGWYLLTYGDVRDAGVDPWDHYLHTGWREGRNPAAWFDTGYYLKANADVAALGCNPFIHYAVAGEAEGRHARAPRDPARVLLDAARPPAERALDWRCDVPPPQPAGRLRDALDACEGRPCVVSLSHDDYRTNFGGVQNCLGDEQRAFATAGWAYLHVRPAQPLPLLAPAEDGDSFPVLLTLDDHPLGCFRFGDLLAEAGRLAGQGWMVVHHLLGFAPEHVARLAGLFGVGRTYLWLHDFFSLCPSFALLRNDLAFCGAPAPGSGACGICAYGEERARHLPRLQAFFEAVRPRLLAPSPTPLDLWRQRAGHWPHQDAQVVPLASLVLGRPVPAPEPARPLRIAHLGGEGWHKGWPVFAGLAERHAADPRYAFLQLGWPRPQRLPRGVQHVPVRVERGRRRAMIDAVAAARVDVALLWPAWPETFSFVAHEAVAAGAFVLTRAGAGNIAPAVTAPHVMQGMALADLPALERLFDSGGLAAMIAGRRRRGALLLGAATADILLPPAPPQGDPPSE